MKYIKKYEKLIKEPDILLYECDDFEISIYSNGSFTFASHVRACSAFMGMVILITSKSKYLSDQKLRNIKIPENNKIKELEYLDLNDNVKIENIRNYRSGSISYFIEKNIPKTDIPKDVFMELTYKYNPKIMIAVANSKTLGDVIDSFKIIYNDLIPDIEIYSKMNKYNL